MPKNKREGAKLVGKRRQGKMENLIEEVLNLQLKKAKKDKNGDVRRSLICFHTIYGSFYGFFDNLFK